MTSPSVARPRTMSRFSGLAWRRARWGYVFIAPWLIGFVLFTALPMVATLVFSLTNINLAQREPLESGRLDVKRRYLPSGEKCGLLLSKPEDV